ncbi:hypothetical protein LQ327_22490 [Actinomycetospora endophytica]|uniref:Protein kinase domain-containing protein n=1 Tax=Actinomycetospora endophytica TaxID=2291215 RepID=A0ABS8PF48_9PSEU|nr:hypothetical protein [Actinomycetospora endophytica]MCD2196145.1 hypothetical protein [Actinomycetospora endophytica]
MTADLTPVDLEPLGLMLGFGGEAVVHEAANLQLAETDAELVYKRYRAPGLADTAHDVVAARLALSGSDRSRLDSLTTWPLRRVVDAGVLHGVVLPRIGPAYIRTMTVPGTGTTKTGPREAQGLMVPEPHGTRVLGATAVPNRDARLVVCRDLAAALMLLHDRMGLAYGDLSAKNVLVRLEEHPRILLIDCDAARPSGSGTTTLHSPDWNPPEGGPATTASDAYKLGLFVLRALTPVAPGSYNRDPSWAINELDADGFDLLRRSLHTDPQRRPRAAEWYVHLSRLLGDPVVPPRFLGCGLSVTVVAPGDTTTVLWRLDEPGEVTVTSHGRTLGSVSAPAGRGRREVSPTTSGVLRLRASNAAGEQDTAAGAVVVLSPHPTADLPVPMPSLPREGLPAAPVPPPLNLPPAVYGSTLTAFPPVPPFWPAPDDGAGPVAGSTPRLPDVPWWLVDPTAVPQGTPTRREARR